jgi:hypothetical protein
MPCLLFNPEYGGDMFIKILVNSVASYQKAIIYIYYYFFGEIMDYEACNWNLFHHITSYLHFIPKHPELYVLHITWEKLHVHTEQLEKFYFEGVLIMCLNIQDSKP